MFSPLWPNNLEYTIEEIGKHNTVNDCWIIVDTFVYDLSTFVSDHPGEIEPLLKRYGTTYCPHLSC